MNYLCDKCNKTYEISPLRYQCDCGNALTLAKESHICPNPQVPAAMSLWRYREALPIDADTEIVTLGEGMTPLVPLDVNAPEHFVKLDYLCPTGSYKDRAHLSSLRISRHLGLRRSLRIHQATQVQRSPPIAREQVSTAPSTVQNPRRREN